MTSIKHLFECWEEIAPYLLGKPILLFLDFDGTLTPIVERPESAHLSVSMKMILIELKLVEDLSLVIVSGRSLEELKRLIGIPGILYVGNHGFEFEGPGFRHTHPGAVESKTIVAEVAEILENSFNSIEGVFVENKTFTLSVHYRQVSEEKVDRVRAIFSKAIDPFLNQAQILFTEGKKVLEVRPALDWNKGEAVSWLYARSLAANPKREILPIYIGDDQTDEPALKAMKDCGVGVKVTGETPESNADYYLRSPDEVHDFLKRLKKLKNPVSEG